MKFLCALTASVLLTSVLLGCSSDDSSGSTSPGFTPSGGKSGSGGSDASGGNTSSGSSTGTGGSGSDFSECFPSTSELIQSGANASLYLDVPGYFTLGPAGSGSVTIEEGSLLLDEVEIVSDFDDLNTTQEVRAYVTSSTLSLNESGTTCSDAAVELWVYANLVVDDATGTLTVVSATGEPDTFGLVVQGSCSSDINTIFSLVATEVAAGFANQFVGQAWACY